MLGATAYSINARKINTGAYKQDYAQELSAQGTSKLVSMQAKENKASGILSKIVPSSLSGLWKNPLVKIAVLGIVGFLVWKYVISRFFGKTAAKRRRAAYARSFVGRKRKGLLK